MSPRDRMGLQVVRDLKEEKMIDLEMYRRARAIRAHEALITLSRAVRAGIVTAVDGPHPQRDVALVLDMAADVRSQIRPRNTR